MAARQLALLVLIVLLVPTLAGCATEEPGRTGDSSAAPSTPGSDPVPVAPGGVEQPANVTLERLSAPTEEVWYFTPTPGLSTTLPEAGEVNVALSPQEIVLGMSVVEFVSEPVAEAMLVHPAPITLDLTFSASAPMVTNGIFDVAAWGGSTRSTPLFAFMTHAPVATPGLQSVKLVLEFGDKHGVLLLPGDSLRFLLTYGFQSPPEAGTVKLVVGGDQASRLTLSASHYAVDPLAGASQAPEVKLTGEVTNGYTLTNCDLQPGITSMTHEVAVPADAVSLQLQLKATQTTAPVADIDFDLFDGATQVAGSHTPSDKEHVFLGAETLEGLQGKTLTLKVSTCGSARIAYEVTVGIAAHAPPAGAAS